MQLRRIQCFAFLSLLFLLSACDSKPITTTQTSKQTPATTHKLLPTTIPTSTQNDTTVPSLPPDCPPVGTIRPVTLQSAPSTASQHVIYYSNQGGIQVSATHGKLMIYNVSTKQTSPLVSFPNPTTGIISAQLSSDGQWLLFVTNLRMQQSSVTSDSILQKLQVVRADGQHLQTLMCNTSQILGVYNTPQWSPDKKHIAFSTFGKNAYVLNILNTLNGNIQAIDGPTNFFVGGWINPTQFYATPYLSDAGPTTSKPLHVFDLNFNTNSSTDHPVSGVSLLNGCNSVQVDSNQKNLITTSCAFVKKTCRSGFGFQGPSALSMRSVDGGTPTSLYSDTSHAITTFQVLDSTNYLIYIQNSAGDLSQNGLWKVSGSDHHLTRLTRESAPTICYDAEGYAGSLPEIFSNGQFYALRIHYTLLLGSLNGEPPTTFYSQTDADMLQLVGFSTI